MFYRLILLTFFLLCGLAGPAWALDPDGTWVTCPGTVVGVDGTWTCPGPAVNFTGQYVLYLNGSPVSTGIWDTNGSGQGYNLRLGNGGHLYTMGTRQFYPGQMYKWNGGGWDTVSHQEMGIFDIHRQVHNAPGWIHSHTYNQGDRVNNGAGWNETTGKFVWDQTLRAYQVISSGSCVSAGSGGPTSQASDITDNTCHWKWLSDTDYVTLYGFGNDGPRWTADHYGWREIVTAPDANGILTAYQNMNETGCVAGPGDKNASPLPYQARGCGYNVTGGCNSAVAPPNNPGTDSCTWVALAPVTYSSGRTSRCRSSDGYDVFNPPRLCIGIPWQLYTYANWFQEQKLFGYQADIWNDREYAMGQNGEAQNPVAVTQQHMDFGNHAFNTSYVIGCGNYGGDGLGQGCGISLVAAPGESFVDYLAANPTQPFTGYDRSRGVGIRGTLIMDDTPINMRRIQITSPDYVAFITNGRELNESSIQQTIVEVGTPGVLSQASIAWGVGTGFSVSNSLVINHSLNAVGFLTAYVGSIVNSTFVAPENNGILAIEDRHAWEFPPQYIHNSVFVGFQHFNGMEAAFYPDIAYDSHNNYTTSVNENVPPGTVPAFDAPWGDGTTIPDVEPPVSGVTYGISTSGLFQGVNDYRIPNTSILHGAGANFGVVKNRCNTLSGQSTGNNYPFNCDYDFYNQPSINGFTRPQTAADVGAWNQTGAAPATFTLTVGTPSNGTISGSGISCGATCTNTYADGATVTLTATPSGGYQFTTWGGVCSGAVSPCSFVIHSNQSVAANFAANSNPVANRMSRLTVRSPGISAGPPPTVGLLQMPAGISGAQTVDVGTGPNTISLFLDGSPGNPDNAFVLYISQNGGLTWTQITDTVNPMTVTSHTGNAGAQFFIFHGNWGAVDSITNMKMVQASSGSLNALWTGSSCCAIFQTYDGVPFTYLGASTKGGAPSQGYTNFNNSALSPVIWSKCTDAAIPAPPGGGSGSWIDCPPVYNGTLSVISGATVDGVTVGDGTLSQIADPVGGDHDVVLPAGHFFGAAVMAQFNSGTSKGNRLHGQGQGVTVIDGKHIAPAGSKALIDVETARIQLSDLTITGAQIGGAADNPNNSSNAGCVFLTYDGVFDNVEFTQCQDGLRGGSNSGAPSVCSNCYFHDNGSRTGFTHEHYMAGAYQSFINNTMIIAGDRPGYAVKNRVPTLINGGYYSSCTDPTAQTCAGLLDFPNGFTNDIQGMNTVTVGGTIHAGDVLTMTFQHLSDTPIVVTSTVAAGPPTAQAATDALLAALKANASLTTAGWGFHASMPVGGRTFIPNAIDLYAPIRLADWTITPTVTGGGATTTLVKTMNPVTLVLNANAQVGNGSTQIIKCQEEDVPHVPCVMNLNNVIIDNRNTNAPRIAVGQWNSTPAMAGTELHISNCVYTGGIAPEITSNWATVTGSCTAAP